ncbi:putative tetratricopeptide-like helical domain superfamily [Septoria linicola]|nr:putative tetratricopeptide-like helical domain superfamily [Septoria linicola]
MGSKPKQFTRPPPKKKPPKAAALVSADDYQEAADFEEAAGGKHRAGDAVKSARAFVRALELYDTGVGKHPKDFDLAYNKARLELEISQQPAILEHIGVEAPEWLERTLASHQHALQLNEQNADILFNTAQVLTSLAEQLTEDDREDEAVPFLQKALEHLSSCLSRQEMMYEQHKLDFPDQEDGGVALEQSEASEKPAPSSDVNMSEQQSAIVETPVSPNDLLDTVYASLSALTTLAPLSDEPALQTLGDLARQLTESKAPNYISLLPLGEQDRARISTAVSRASFVAAYASAQFSIRLIELQTYIERLNAFDIPGKEGDADALVAEAEARTELVMSTIDRFGESPDIPATLCWKELTTSQDLYSKATKLTTESAQESKAEVYKSKGDLEILRHRLIHIPKTDLSDSTRKSAETLIKNAQTFYKGAVNLAKADGDEDVEEESKQRLGVAKEIAALMYGGEKLVADETLMEALESCVEEGLVSQQLAEAIFEGQSASGS